MTKKLATNPRWNKRNGPLVLCILDGVAHGKNPEADAVQQADTPCLDWLAAHCPKTELKAHGKAVGLPSDADMGNSEVGHNTLGSGRVFEQGASLVNKAIDSGAMFSCATWKKLLSNVAQHHSTLHLIGLLSDGNVHSHVNHLYRIIEKAVGEACKRIRVHAMLDGRDVGEFSALDYFEPLEKYCHALSERGVDARIASGGGRMKITMDRYEADWPMVERGWQHHVLGEGEQFASVESG